MDDGNSCVLRAFFEISEKTGKRREIKFSKAINSCCNVDGTHLTPEQGLLFAILLQAIKDLVDLYNLKRYWISNGISMENFSVKDISTKLRISKGMAVKVIETIIDGKHAQAFFRSTGLANKRRIGTVHYRFKRGHATRVVELFDFESICDELGIVPSLLRSRLGNLLKD